MKGLLLHIVCVAFAAAMAGDIEVARQALHDRVWRSAIVSADLAATNAAQRTEARLISLEALAQLEDDDEIRRRLSMWSDEKGDAFRYWLARAQVRLGDFSQAKATLEAPFADASLALPVACLKASMMISEGDKSGALALLESAKPEGKPGAAGEDARLMMGEILSETGKTNEARKLLAPIAKDAGRKEMQLRAGYLLGFSEMADVSTRTSGTARVRALLRKYPDAKLSIKAAKQFADRLLSFGDASGADDEYRRYLEVNPSAVSDAEVLIKKAQALHLLGRKTEAAGAFARAERAATNKTLKAQASYRQAEMLLAEERYDEAAASFARSAEYGGDGSVRAKFAEADARERGGEYDQAERIYGELMKSGGAWGARAQLRVTAGMLRKGQLATAMDEYSKLIGKTNLLSSAEITQAYLGRGRACYRGYRFNDAASDFKVVAEREPARADVMRFLQALCLYGAGRDVDAKAEVASLMTSTKDEQLRAELMLWCAKYEFNHAEYADAKTHFETFASLRPGEMRAADALLWAARCASATMDYSKAVELATQSANSSSNRTLFVEALLVQGEALMELGRYHEAAQIFDRVVTQASDGPNAIKAAAFKADALYAMGAGDTNRYEEAISAYRALPGEGSLSPDRRIEVAFKIGRALERLRKTSEAMDQYYRHVVLAYLNGVKNDQFFGAPARTFFARAAFLLVDYYASAGDLRAAKKILEYVVAAKVPASAEAKRKLDALKLEGGIE